ncbi:hypothetical protein AgCh_015595 [Apium graveolens]
MMRSFVDEKQNPLIWASTCHAGECFDRVAVGEANFIGKLISSKTVRKELRKHQRVAAERMCDICQHNVLPGKDVATLMNIRPAFHVFHTSCLVHLTLLTELEIHNNQNAAGSEVKQRGRKKGGDPLDFRLANAASHSVQSTSLTDQQPEQFVISEQTENMKHIQETLATPIGATTDFDEDELEASLEEIESAELEEEILQPVGKPPPITGGGST